MRDRLQFQVINIIGFLSGYSEETVRNSIKLNLTGLQLSQEFLMVRKGAEELDLVLQAFPKYFD